MRTILVTGGSGGIGSETARRLVARGDRPVLLARDADRLAAIAGELDVPSYVCDVLDADALLATVQRIEDEVAPLDGLVHAVGSITLRPLNATTVAEFRAAFETNATSAFLALKSVLPGMMRRRTGSIVLFSTVAVKAGLPNHETIAASKGAIEGMVRSAAISYSRYGIRINAVAPALTRTPLSRSLWENEMTLAASAAMHPLGRIGEPGDVAGAVVYLLSDDAAWTTGQILGVDGGLSVGRPQATAKRP